MGGVGRDRETQPGAKDDAVCVWYAHGVCGYACVWCAGGQRQRDTVRQRIMCMDGYPTSFACVS